jgi:hypothetical protein
MLFFVTMPLLATLSLFTPDTFMSMLVPSLVSLIISITLIKLMIDFGQFKRVNSVFASLGKQFLAPFGLPAQSKTLVNAFRAELLQVSADMLNLDPQGLLAFYDRLAPDHPRWSKLIGKFRLLTECLLFASTYLNAADRLLTQREYAGLVELFSSQRRQFDFSDGTHLTIVPARICYEIRDRIRTIRQELDLYESYGNCWPEDKPVPPTVEVAPTPVSPPTQWPAQSPVYVAGNASPSHGSFQSSRITYQGTNRVNRSGSTRLRSGLSEGYWIDDYSCDFESDDKPASFGSDDRSSGQCQGLDDNSNDSFGSDD